MSRSPSPSTSTSSSASSSFHLDEDKNSSLPQTPDDRKLNEGKHVTASTAPQQADNESHTHCDGETKVLPIAEPVATPSAIDGSSDATAKVTASSNEQEPLPLEQVSQSDEASGETAALKSARLVEEVEDKEERGEHGATTTNNSDGEPLATDNQEHRSQDHNTTKRLHPDSTEDVQTPCSRPSSAASSPKRSSSSSSSYAPLTSQESSPAREEKPTAADAEETSEIHNKSDDFTSSSARDDDMNKAERCKVIPQPPPSRKGPRLTPITKGDPNEANSEGGRHNIPTSNSPSATPQRSTAQRINPKLVVASTPKHISKSDTMADLFLIKSNTPAVSHFYGYHSHSIVIPQRTSVEDIKLWLSPYEMPSVRQHRYIHEDVEVLDSARKREADAHKQKVAERKAAEQKRQEELEKQEQAKAKVATPSARLCKPKVQKAKVGHYAPTKPLTAGSSHCTTPSGGHPLKGRNVSDGGYSEGDRTPHFMKPLKPPIELAPLDFRPRTQQFHRGGGGDDEEGGTAGSGGALTSDEFADRFYGSQLEAHKAALNKAYLKLTGAPMPPPVVPRAKREPEPTNNKDAEEEEDDEEDEKKEKELEFAREIARKHHDEELASRERRRDVLLTKYNAYARKQAGPFPRQPSPEDNTISDKMYRKQVEHQTEYMKKLWDSMDQRMKDDSIHSKVVMDDEKWKGLIERCNKR